MRTEFLQKIAELKKETGKLSKDSSNPFFKSKYFDINQLLEHLEPIAESKGLLILQPIIDGSVVSQIIDIESGDKIESSILLSSVTDPQKKGSEITYFRRYSLTSLLGLQAEDDDANKASGKTPTKAVENELPWFNDKQLEGVKKALSENKEVTLEAIKKKYKVSKPMLEKLIELNIL